MINAASEMAREALLTLIDLTDRQESLPRKMACATALMAASIPLVLVLDLAYHWDRTDSYTYDLYN